MTKKQGIIISWLITITEAVVAFQYHYKPAVAGFFVALACSIFVTMMAIVYRSQE